MNKRLRDLLALAIVAAAFCYIISAVLIMVGSLSPHRVRQAVPATPVAPIQEPEQFHYPIGAG